MTIHRLLLFTLIVGTGLFIYQIGPKYIQEKVIKNHITEVITATNNFSWEEYSGTEGIQYFSNDLQQKLFLNDLDFNQRFVREQKIISTCYIERFKEIRVYQNQAQVALDLRHTIQDINDKITYTTAVVLSLQNIDGRWIIENVFFSRGGKFNEEKNDKSGIHYESNG